MKCMNCSSTNMIYLGKGKLPAVAFIGSYIYVCKDCKELMWSTTKEKTKLKWYKEKEFINELKEQKR